MRFKNIFGKLNQHAHQHKTTKNIFQRRLQVHLEPTENLTIFAYMKQTTDIPFLTDLPVDKPLILVTNDDSIHAPGIHRLAELVAPMGHVVIIAPHLPQSGKSSALTVSRPLIIHRHDDFNGIPRFSIEDGTPVDCVKLGIHAILGRNPDLVLAGINHGSNSAVNIIYSGTMGAVLEGCILGIPSIGYSYHDHDESADISATYPVVTKVTKAVLEHGLPDQICLNVNIPRCSEVKGIKVCRDTLGYWAEGYEEYHHPSGKPFFWLTGKFHSNEPDNPETDMYWIDRGYATIVPSRPDQSAPTAIKDIESIID